MKGPGPYPVGVVGKIRGGRYDGFFVEVDDDSTRPNGTGGWYVLYWTAGEGYDDWVERVDQLSSLLGDLDIEWMTAEQSTTVPGRHRHGQT